MFSTSPILIAKRKILVLGRPRPENSGMSWVRSFKFEMKCRPERYYEKVRDTNKRDLSASWNKQHFNEAAVQSVANARS